MEEKKTVGKGAHNIIMEGRRKMSVSGVTEVGNFNEEKITLDTDMGTLSVTGENLHINKLSVETGDVEIEGTVNSFSYSERGSARSAGFLSKILK